MALYIPHSIFNLVRLLYVRPETFGPYYVEQVNRFTYLGCSVSYQCFNDAEFKLPQLLQLIGSIKRNIFKRVRIETVLIL